MKRRIISILLLLTLVAPLAGTFTWLHFRKQEIRREVKESILSDMDTATLHKLSFTREEADKQLDWEHEGEFEYRGVMYDVVETLYENDRIVYLCWPDSEETELNKDLSRLILNDQQHDEQSRDGHEKLISVLRALYIERLGVDLPLRTYSEIEVSEFTCFNYSEPYLSLSTPPPTF